MPSSERPDATHGERADAAINRAALLAAARRIAAVEGVSRLTTDRLAREAGVGKGTVFRRFGSRSGVLDALLREREHDLLELCTMGPPPLGPSAPPAERISAFGRTRCAFIVRNEDLFRDAGNPRGPAVVQHFATLLEQGSPGTASSQSVPLARLLLVALDETVLEALDLRTAETAAAVAEWERLALLAARS